MEVAVCCPNCAHEQSVNTSLLGKKIRCVACLHLHTVASSGGPAAQEAGAKRAPTKPPPRRSLGADDFSIDEPEVAVELLEDGIGSAPRRGKDPLGRPGGTKKRRDGDEEDDEVPSRKRRGGQRQERPSILPVVLTVGAFLVLLVGVGAYLAYLSLATREPASGQLAGDDTEPAPADTPEQPEDNQTKAPVTPAARVPKEPDALPPPTEPGRPVRLSPREQIGAHEIAVVSSDGRDVLVFNEGGRLNHYRADDFGRKGTYQLDRGGFYEAALDRKGNLYAIGLSPRARAGSRRVGPGDLYLYRLAGQFQGRPAPSTIHTDRVITLGRTVNRLLVDPEGNWLYYLDVRARKVGRVDPRVDQLHELTLPGEVEAMCLTPDGSKLLVVGGSTLRQIDTSRWRLGRETSLQGAYRDVQATDDGRVFLLSGSAHANSFVSVLDTAEGGDESRWATLSAGQTLALSSDGRTLFVPASAAPQLLAFSVPEQRVRQAASAPQQTALGTAEEPRGRVVVSPDGKFVLSRGGRVVRVE